jgi:hypothetical protein
MATCWVRWGIGLLGMAIAVRGQAGGLPFRAAGAEFVFDTGVLRGKLREGGRATGLSRVEYVPQGIPLSSSMGLLSHYRVFTKGKRYGDGAWSWPGEAKLTPEGEVEVFWPAEAGRPFELGARYRWREGNWVEVETRVRAIEELVDFESFLACYFTKDFNFSAAWAGAPLGWVEAAPEHGAWQMFPRDRGALALIRDGRWKIPPNPVDWAIRPELAAPIALRRARDLGLAVVLMAAPEDCFAVATPHHQDPHNSLYLSLFGRTIRAGESAKARASLAVISDSELGHIEAMYREWLSTLRNRR